MTLPSATDDYAAPNGMPLNKAAWDAALTDVGARLRAAEAIRADFSALIASGTGEALTVIAANVGPTLATLEASITTAQAAITTALGQVDTLMTGVNAAAVPFTPTGSIASTNVQAAIAEVASEAATAIAAKADSSALAAKADASAVAAIRNQSFISVSTNTTLVAGSAYRITGGASITLTLPAAPAAGDTIRIVDGGVVSVSNLPVIGRNGNPIMAIAANMTIDAPGADFLLWWTGSDWRLF